MEPTQFGRYEVIAEIGRGSMGLVYKAADPMLNRLVAIKTINLHLDQDDRADYEARFTVEAKAAGALSHPNIVTIYDLGRVSDVVYIAMEYLDGKDMAALVSALGAFPVAVATSLATQLADALHHAHEKGIVHRDIKPANIMVLKDNVVKLTDFGIARLRSQESKTQTGMRMGSPLYMSPEQVLGHRSDPRSDIFSLGIVLYEMLTGKPPFGGSSLESIMYQTINIAPPLPSRVRPEVPQIIDLVLARMLEKAPENRYQSAREVADDLRECLKVIAESAADGAGDLSGRDQAVDLLAYPEQLKPRVVPNGGISLDLAALTAPVPATGSPEASLGGAALVVSRDFDSAAATQKLSAGLSSPFDVSPAPIALAPSKATVVADPKRVEMSFVKPRTFLPLSALEIKVVAGIIGGALLTATLIVVV